VEWPSTGWAKLAKVNGNRGSRIELFTDEELVSKTGFDVESQSKR
jgi:hypothetical protein